MYSPSIAVEDALTVIVVSSSVLWSKLKMNVLGEGLEKVVQGSAEPFSLY
jgi:hypothetical protein